MAITTADIDALHTALAQGESRVKMADGSEVEYRSVPDLEAALDRLLKDKARQDATATNQRPVRQVRLYHAGRGN